MRKPKHPQMIYCDFEQLTDDGQCFVTNDSTVFLKSAASRTTEESKSGKYAVKLSAKQPYGPRCTLKNLKKGEYFQISVWKKGKEGKGIIVADIRENNFYLATRKTDEIDSNGWERLKLDIFIPPDIKHEELIIYTWNPDPEDVYFDDIKITSTPSKIYPDYEEESLRIFLDTLDKLKLEEKRFEAFKVGILESGNNDWVRGILFCDHDMKKAKLRLKGDWLDHLRGDKWSFRIKMNRDYSWKNMRTFSIQTPLARDFLNEWLAHRVFLKEDVLSPRYEFIPVKVKDKSLGYYAYEEHFDKQLIESRERREGPILKFTEEAFWSIQKVFLKTKWYHKLPCYEVSVIEPFHLNRTLEDSTLFKQFLIAQNLMFEYKNSLAPPSEIFDLENLAKYYALNDVLKSHHAIAWHNQRFYYNPVLCKLEPIAFDAYTDRGVKKMGNQTVVGEFDIRKKTEVAQSVVMHYNLFKEAAFTNRYIHYLEKYSDEEYICSILNELKPEIKYYESRIRKEFPAYQYDTAFLFNNAAEIRAILPGYKKKVLSNPDYVETSLKEFEVFSDFDTMYHEIFPEYYVTAFLEEKNNDYAKIRVNNYFTQDILLLGTGRNQRRIRYFLHPEPSIPAYKGGKDNSVILTTDTTTNFLYFMVKGHLATHIIPIHQWPSPRKGNPRRELTQLSDFPNDLAYEVLDDQIVIFREGKYIIDRFLVIPEGYTVKFLPGVIIDFRKRAGLISHSPVFMTGEKNRPVIITSSDSSAMGFTVLQAGSMSIISHVIFEHLNTLDYKGWTLTGAVNFYESNVKINQTVFQNNHCEDALNIIRSDFVLNDVLFKDIAADAFDGDFASGQIMNSKFRDITNDAIDFSGSTITITDCQIENANDKAISGGEASMLQMENIIINGCNIGIASKDLSTVIGKNISIFNCRYGIVAFRKKPEFGPGEAIIKGLKYEMIDDFLWVEEGSKVILNDSVVEGDKKNGATLFY